jgi:hypothetical protein
VTPDPALVERWVRETRARQGLGPTVEDEGVLAELAADVAAALTRQGNADA